MLGEVISGEVIHILIIEIKILLKITELFPLFNKILRKHSILN